MVFHNGPHRAKQRSIKMRRVCLVVLYLTKFIKKIYSNERTNSVLFAICSISIGKHITTGKGSSLYIFLHTQIQISIVLHPENMFCRRFKF